VCDPPTLEVLLCFVPEPSSSSSVASGREAAKTA
jgi:hypothetical protein